MNCPRISTITVEKLVICFLTLFFIHSSSKQEPRQDSDKPHVNFSGELVTVEGEKSLVENITIGVPPQGKYRQIYFYAVPKSSDIDPSVHNRAFIDLDDVYQIKAPTPTSPTQSRQALTFNKRGYIEVVVINNDSQKTENHYLIDAYHMLICDFIQGNKRQRREISFLAVQTLTLTSYKMRESPDEKKLKEKQESAAHAAVCQQAKEDIKALKARPLDQEVSEKIEKLEDAVTNLCSLEPVH